MYFYYGNSREELLVTVRTTEFFLDSLVMDGYLEEEDEEAYFEADDYDEITELEDVISQAIIERVEEEIEKAENDILCGEVDEINFMDYTSVQQFETAILFDPILKEHISTQYVNQNKSRFIFC